MTFRVAIIVALVLLLAGFVSIVWTPYPPTAPDIGAAMQDPSGAHWLGTDQLGRDILSLLMKGILTSFVVAAVAVAIGALIGVPIGLGAERAGDLVERAVLASGQFFYAFPALVMAILIATAFGPGAPTTMVAVGIFSIPVFIRAARDAARSANGLDYVEAARLAGIAQPEVWRRHLAPIYARALGAVVLRQLAIAVLAEAAFAYVGLGAAPPATSLGLMLRDAQAYAQAKPNLMIAPGLLIVIIALTLNIAAAGARQMIDARHRPAEVPHGAA